MKFDESFDILVYNEEPTDLFEHLKRYENYKGSLSTVNKHIDSKTDRVRYYKEFTALHTENTLYRKRDDSSDAIVALWMSRVKNIVAMYTAMNDVKKFKSISKQELSEIAKLSRNTEQLSELESYLIKKGIILVLEPSINGLKLDGSVYINSLGQAVVALSLRMNRLDNFWFTLMHELAHLCLHPEQLSQPILEDLEQESVTLIEKQADKLALNSFISRSAWRTCSARISFKKEELYEFSERINVHPAIVAGRIRRETKRYDRFSDIVNEVDVRRIFGYE
ncbi:ImmA/IrrE family metallo-endopeptidase [Vibrio europaeus]|uniref:ImmA/IrrE family metallo-endopeptidase n=1 Tax=Vibrio europaeus TaxID=300876 RepID=UPI0018A777AD|nr:ImmA/IrrE family metallo-endopeptidase [Vibrio europaeus]MDC5809274.1 ImmA/IrrE family metallo-endopeptidase [Vibrio europaeus]QPG36811.1 ImmA/IrrE family metallo-endopeptidase [Vibrio europaeus]